MAARAVSQRSESKDAFLVQCKLSGMSYKEIKEKGQFSEAESTLRGRFRTLTKRKEHRVRKPEWHGNDVSTILSGIFARDLVEQGTDYDLAEIAMRSCEEIH